MAVALIAVAVFAIGIITGVIFIASVGIQREERNLRGGLVSMTGRVSGQASHGVRFLTALRVGDAH